jgi:predicted O-methyltransferase YrrM
MDGMDGKQPPAERLVVGALARLAPSRRDQVVDKLLRPVLRRAFELGQRAGVHLTPSTFYSPIPDTRTLPASLWEPRAELPGVDLRERAQVELLDELASAWRREYDALPRTPAGPGEPPRFYLHNRRFGAVDAEIAYAMVRQHKPRRIVEIGSGQSTLLLLEALRANERDGAFGQVTACEPYPDDYVREAAADSRLTLEAAPLQDVPLDVFTALGKNDVVFIDSTHVCRIGSDVQYELLEILPRLAPGVLVHVHDVFLPAEYPRDWVVRQHRFWNEQYVLQAFLAFNSAFEVVWGSSLMHLRHPGRLAAAVASYDEATQHPGSFWIRRTTA